MLRIKKCLIIQKQESSKNGKEQCYHVLLENGRCFCGRESECTSMVVESKKGFCCRRQAFIHTMNTICCFNEHVHVHHGAKGERCSLFMFILPETGERCSLFMFILPESGEQCSCSPTVFIERVHGQYADPSQILSIPRQKSKFV